MVRRGMADRTSLPTALWPPGRAWQGTAGAGGDVLCAQRAGCVCHGLPPPEQNRTQSILILAGRGRRPRERPIIPSGERHIGERQRELHGRELLEGRHGSEEMEEPEEDKGEENSEVEENPQIIQNGIHARSANSQSAVTPQEGQRGTRAYHMSAHALLVGGVGCSDPIGAGLVGKAKEEQRRLRPRTALCRRRRGWRTNTQHKHGSSSGRPVSSPGIWSSRTHGTRLCRLHHCEDLEQLEVQHGGHLPRHVVDELVIGARRGVTEARFVRHKLESNSWDKELGKDIRGSLQHLYPGEGEVMQRPRLRHPPKGVAQHHGQGQAHR